MSRPRATLSEIETDVIVENMAAVGNLARAAASLGRSVAAVKRHADRFPEFADRLEQARLEFCGKLELAAITRAVDGIPKGVWHQGIHCGTETVYSDSLLSKLLEANIDKYRSKQHIQLEETNRLTSEEKASRIAAVLRKVAEREASEPASPDDPYDLIG